MINRKDKKIINEAIKNIIGDIGFLSITNDDNIFYIINGEKVKSKHKLEKITNLVLPSIEEIILEVRKLNSSVNTQNLQNIEYILEKTTFNKKVVVNIDSDIIIYGCRFINGLNIENAKKVKFIQEYNSNNHFRNDIECRAKLEINAEELYLNRCQLNMHSGYLKESYINFNVDKLIMNEVELYSTRKIYINSKSLKITNSNLSALAINFNSDKIFEDHNKFSAIDLISINDRNCDLIYNVNAPKVLYNGIDITNSEKMKLSTSRHELLETLKKLRSKCDESIKNDTKKYQDRIKRQPLVKRIKKS